MPNAALCAHRHHRRVSTPQSLACGRQHDPPLMPSCRPRAGQRGHGRPSIGRRNARFDCCHTCIELGIVCFTISAGMNTSMTVRAKSYHMGWMIGAAIA
jgi:hypothetical protein